MQRDFKNFSVLLANNLKFNIASFSAVKTHQLLQRGLQLNWNLLVYLFNWYDTVSV